MSERMNWHTWPSNTNVDKPAAWDRCSVCGVQRFSKEDQVMTILIAEGECLPIDQWAIICVDDGLTIDWTGDPRKMPDWIAPAAQQEFDKWPTIEPMFYMLIAPSELPIAQELNGRTLAT